MKVIANVRVGRPDTTPSRAAHTWGVRKGNEPKGFVGDPGHYYAGETGAGRPIGKATARRSTGVNPAQRNPIDPGMPNLPPP